MSETVRNITINGKDITLIGTAHVSRESAIQVENLIR